MSTRGDDPDEWVAGRSHADALVEFEGAAYARLASRIQLSYAGLVPDGIYVFTERSYQQLAKAEISPLSVTDVLYGRQVVRRHIGAFLQVAGPDRYGTWLAVALIEGVDDEYTVTSARCLDDAEIAAIARMTGDQHDQV